ncbi:NTP pyrophosphohydrolase [Belliella baltica DSM 15883]|uniref:GDP-mannose pyrophosphatase n=1 Tax=Belliella baltica (strain DSM 15883 / CIP 108006 / LMG 21964 / BA134) TaxID=866536 RepID=I3Z6V7_BELBD|nr:NUDIX hydrolase [Belliella baltica]AFL84975.1 NTP pyrophosphohydrolase [Belliella baltica DSM 15883]
MKNPWQTKNSKTIYENAWIKLEHHDVVIPSGKDGVYGKVCFKNKAIGIIPIDKEGNTWLVGQYRYTLNAYSLEIPMGGGPINEDFLDSAKRELKEETGLTAEKWTKIMTIHTSNSVTDEEGFIYLAEELTKGETEFEETEQLEIVKLPLSLAVQKVMEGEITDAISIAGLLKVAKMFNL